MGYTTEAFLGIDLTKITTKFTNVEDVRKLEEGRAVVFACYNLKQKFNDFQFATAENVLEKYRVKLQLVVA